MKKERIVGFLACLGMLSFMSNMVIASPNNTSQKEKACVQYQRMDGSWGKNYNVRGYLVKGDKINKWYSERDQFAQYDEERFYYVINWKRGNQTVIDLGRERILPSIFRQAKDQDDRIWMIRKGYCNY